MVFGCCVVHGLFLKGGLKDAVGIGVIVGARLLEPWVKSTNHHGHNEIAVGNVARHVFKLVFQSVRGYLGVVRLSGLHVFFYEPYDFDDVINTKKRLCFDLCLVLVKHFLGVAVLTDDVVSAVGQVDAVLAQKRQEFAIDALFDCVVIQIHGAKINGLVSMSQSCVHIVFQILSKKYYSMNLTCFAAIIPAP